MKSIVVTLTLIAFSLPLYAIDAYKCTVKEAKRLSNDGVLEESEYAKQSLPAGSEFIVDKHSGRASGAIRNHKQYAEPEVLTLGSEQTGYRALTINGVINRDESGGLVYPMYLYIGEHRKSSEKPFYYVDRFYIVTGSCIPY